MKLVLPKLWDLFCASKSDSLPSSVMIFGEAPSVILPMFYSSPTSPRPAHFVASYRYIKGIVCFAV
jgi:hypothetical protein